MPMHLSRLGRTLMTGAGLSSVALALAAASVSSVDMLLERSFARALEQGAPPQVLAKATPSAAHGGEELLLREARHGGAANEAVAAGQLTAGSRITFSIGERDHVLEVIDVREVSGGLTKAGTAAALGDRMVIVTCRMAGGEPEDVVRLMFGAAEKLPAWLGPKHERTL